MLRRATPATGHLLRSPHLNNLVTKTQRPLSRWMASSSVKAAVEKDNADEELKVVGPEPKRFAVADGQLAQVAASSLTIFLRFGSGAITSGYTATLAKDDGRYSLFTIRGRKLQEGSLVPSFKRPAQPIQLYEFEGCPYCKKVREALAYLDLDALVYPTPKGGVTWRPQAVALGGKAQFPFLVDPNTGRSMYESDEIIKYLFQEYGNGTVPWPLRMGAFTMLTCALALAPRMGAGSYYKPSKVPPKPLVMWGYEASPFVKVVREVLCELELPYRQVTCARGSTKREELKAKRGGFQVPYLEDSNTGVAMFESAAIAQYLRDTYGVDSSKQ